MAGILPKQRIMERGKVPKHVGKEKKENEKWSKIKKEAKDGGMVANAKNCEKNTETWKFGKDKNGGKR